MRSAPIKSCYNLHLVCYLDKHPNAPSPASHILQIPWTNLGKSAVVVHIDRLYILAGPKTEAASAEDGTYEASICS